MRNTEFFSTTKYRFQRQSLAALLIVLLGVVELGVGSGALVTRPYLLALPLFPVLILALSARLEYGVAVVLLCMVVIRVGLSTGTASKIPLSLLFIGFWFILWLVKMALNRNIRFVVSGVNLPIVVFMVLVVVTLFWSRFLIDPQILVSDSFFRVQLGTIGVTFGSVLLVILCINLIRQNWLIRASYWIILGASLFYLPFYSYEVIFLGSSAPSGITLQTLSRLINAGGLFPMWFCAITLAMLLKVQNLTRWQKILMVIGLLGWCFRLFVLTLVRISGWVPTLAAMLVVLFLYSKKWFFFCLLLGAVLIAFNYQTLYTATVGEKEKEGTLAGDTSRSSLLGQAFIVAGDHLVLGTGPAGYANYYMTYFHDHALSTHNNYLDILLQYGLLGIGVFGWLCFALIKELWKTYRMQKPGTFEQAFVLGAFGGACGMMPGMWLGDWVIPFAYNQTIAGFDYTGYNWLFIGLALALRFIKSPEAKMQVSP